MTATLLKSYIHCVDLEEDLRNELVFSDPDRIRMYSDDQRLGIRLRPVKYNKPAGKVEFPNAALEFDQLAPASKPSARFWADIAYDSNRGVHVLYGGATALTGSALADTWEFDGTNWTQVFPASNPGNRAGHRMIFDTARNVVVLYGGYNGTSIVDETWEYDGTNWTQVFPASSPGGRFRTSMYWDSGRGRIVLFGGEGPAFGTDNNDTWEYYSGNWNNVVTVDSPAVRRYQKADYDTHRSVGVLHGGIDPSNPTGLAFRDTWEYNGTNWVKVSTLNAPGSRIFPGQYYDPVLQCIVLYGGQRQKTGDGFYKDVWGYDGTDWFTIEAVAMPRDLFYDNESYDTDRCKALLWVGMDAQSSPLDDTYWLEFENTDLTCRLPDWSPQAVKGWGGFEESTERQSGLIVQWRVSDGFADYWHDGSAWVVPTKASEWNTETELSANLQTFPHTQKTIQFVCRLISASRWKTPVMTGTRILMTASFDWFEDLILRSLVPRLREDFTFLMDWSGVLEAASDRFNIQSDYPFKPEEDLSVTGIEAVYNDDTDPDHDTDLLQSFDPNTGEAILTATLPAGTRLFYRLEVTPEVAVNYTNTDYDEIGKTPTVIIDQIDFDGRQVKAVADMALKDRNEGRKLDQPLWIERVRVRCALITGKVVSALRLMTQAYAFVIRGATQQPGHKIGPILTTKALDLEHTLKIIPVSRYNPKPQFSDLKESTFELCICDVYAWLRDMETTPLVTRFNTTVEDMREAGTGNPDDKAQPLPAGAIPTLYRTPEVEEV